ncbi:MAG: hypothetical protein HY334_04520, partial [Armatimonadetes bacterium]|nr:hypothetical protein [Armatimonadota bacterium]
ERITEEARWGEEVVGDPRCRPTLLCPDRVTLRIPAANPVRPGSPYEVTFSHDARARTVLRRQGRTEQVVGDKVAALEFRYLTADAQPAATADAVARIALLVTARPSPEEAGRTIQTDFLLRNIRPPAGAAAPAPPTPPAPAFRPAPAPPSGLGPIVRATPPQPPPQGGAPVPPPAPAPGQPVCPQAELPSRRPPARPEVRGALVEITDWEITRAASGALVVEADVENLEAHPVLGVRISATGYALEGTAVATASVVVPEVAEGDFEAFRITLSSAQPVLWLVLKVEQYLPRPTAPLHAALAEVPLALYQEVAKERIVISATLLPSGPASRQIACVAIADTAGFPVASARVTVEVAAVGQRTVTQTLELQAGKTVSFPLTWTSRVLPGVTVNVEEVRLAPGG